jgi:hypothetical protein
MFGKMMISPRVQVESGTDLHTAIATLLQAADQPEIVRWIEFPASVLLFLFVPGDPESGAAYILDRKKVPGTPSISRTNNTADTA